MTNSYGVWKLRLLGQILGGLVFWYTPFRWSRCFLSLKLLRRFAKAVIFCWDPSPNCSNLLSCLFITQLLEGQSSAKGGPTYQNDDEEEGARLVGVPVEFDNICEAMKYFSKRENLNINTQVIGFGHKKKHDLLPLQGNKCGCSITAYKLTISFIVQAQ